MFSLLRRFLLCLPLIAVASLGACTLFRSNLSYVDDLPGSDRANVAAIIAALVADSMPPDGKPIALVAPLFTQSSDPFTGELKSTLEDQGLKVVEEDTRGDDVHHLRYLLTAHKGGYLLRVSLNDTESSTLLSRGNNGQLVASTPLAVREAIR